MVQEGVGGRKALPGRAVRALGLGHVRAGVLKKRKQATQMPSEPGPAPLPPALKHKLLGNFPRELASSEMAIARRLLVDGLLQIQIPDDDTGPKVKVLTDHI